MPLKFHECNRLSPARSNSNINSALRNFLCSHPVSRRLPTTTETSLFPLEERGKEAEEGNLTRELALPPIQRPRPPLILRRAPLRHLNHIAGRETQVPGCLRLVIIQRRRGRQRGSRRRSSQARRFGFRRRRGGAFLFRSRTPRAAGAVGASDRGVAVQERGGVRGRRILEEIVGLAAGGVGIEGLAAGC